MRSYFSRYRWAASAVVLTAWFALSAVADDGSAVLDVSYWLWLAGRIGIPGG